MRHLPLGHVCALVCLCVRPKLNVVVGGQLRHSGEVALDDLLIDHRKWSDDVLSRSEYPLDVHQSAPCHVSQAAVGGEAVEGVAVTARDGVSRDECVDGRFLGGFSYGVKDPVEWRALRPELALDQHINRM